MFGFLSQTMILNNLTVDDNAVIQCNASNSFGYDFVNAFINVLREPPYIYEAPPKNLRQTEGAMVLLPCRSYSAPRALVAWRKDGRPINGGRYQVMENGDLIIEASSSTIHQKRAISYVTPQFHSSPRSSLERTQNSLTLSLITCIHTRFLMRFIGCIRRRKADKLDLKVSLW